MLSWILDFALGRKVAFYCSDVSGAFDKVEVNRLLQKLECLGISKSLLAVLRSWLRPRVAQVVVAGQASDDIQMANMVYQGTVWGPPLWNCFYADARKAIITKAFTEIVFADDLNAFKSFVNSTPDAVLFEEMNTV